MRTFVKIEGKDKEEVVKKLAKLALNIPEVCVWDVNMLNDSWAPGRWSVYKDAPTMAETGSYFGMEPGEFAKICDRVVSKSGANLEGADIYFEWAKEPMPEQKTILEKRIVDVVKPYKMKYTITHKK